MRSLAFAAIAALGSAGAVHDFAAESHYICMACQEAVKFAAKGDDSKLDALFEAHPKLNELINRFAKLPELVNLDDPEGTCKAFSLCEEASIYELLQAEQPHDLSRHIEIVNSNPKSNWVAGTNEKFANASLKEIRKMMGTIVDPDWAITLPEKRSATVYTDVEAPESFDSREAWPECESVINHVRDQSNCGSCWAHGTTEALNDRLCIATGGEFTTLLSVSDTTACCGALQCGSFGCNGGQVGTPWSWFSRTGVVTGGDYGTTGTCYNYTMEKCSHHVEGDLPSCDDVVQVAPTCNSSCVDDDSRSYSDDKHTASSSYSIRGVEKIKNEIMTYGTVTAAFTVYEDFLTYKSGVYSHQTGSALGGHAIKTIGWGTENGEDYWLCVNSWNNTWGDEGTFKIKQGECGINGQMHAGLAGQ